jgi:hypothetical protein
MSPAAPAARPEYRPSQAKFEGTTTNRDAYVPHDIASARPATAMPPQQARQQLPFEGTSSYAAEYHPHEIHVCPAALLPPPPAKDTAPQAYHGAHVFWDPEHQRWSRHAASRDVPGRSPGRH